MRTNPGVDQVSRTAEQKDLLGSRQVLLAAKVLTPFGGVVDQFAASLAGEIVQRIPIHHGCDATGQ